MKSLVKLILIILSGFLLSKTFNLTQIIDHSLLQIFVYFLLCIGLYGSVYSIDLKELALHNKIIFSAVTAGVIFKTVFIGTIFFLLFRNPLAFLLAATVAQIDPIGTTKLITKDTHLSNAGQTIIRAWSSFDDPMTVLIAFYILSPTLLNQAYDFNTYLSNLLLNFVASISVFFVVKFLKPTETIKLIILGLVFLVSVYFQLTLFVAICGLILRPKNFTALISFEKLLNGFLNIAFYVSIFIIGVYSVNHINISEGISLGVLAVVSQIIAGLYLTRKLHRKDKINIALAQYNGITSIILAIYFEEKFSGMVAVVIVAIITINLLYYINDSVIKPRLLTRNTI